MKPKTGNTNKFRTTGIFPLRPFHQGRAEREVNLGKYRYRRDTVEGRHEKGSGKK
jgi:hypothetical protein